eukprot:gene11785-5122_t
MDCEFCVSMTEEKTNMIQEIKTLKEEVKRLKLQLHPLQDISEQYDIISVIIKFLTLKEQIAVQNLCKNFILHELLNFKELSQRMDSKLYKELFLMEINSIAFKKFSVNWKDVFGNFSNDTSNCFVCSNNDFEYLPRGKTEMSFKIFHRKCKYCNFINKVQECRECNEFPLNCRISKAQMNHKCKTIFCQNCIRHNSCVVCDVVSCVDCRTHYFDNYQFGLSKCKNCKKQVCFDCWKSSKNYEEYMKCGNCKEITYIDSL